MSLSEIASSVVERESCLPSSFNCFVCSVIRVRSSSVNSISLFLTLFIKFWVLSIASTNFVFKIENSLVLSSISEDREYKVDIFSSFSMTVSLFWELLLSLFISVFKLSPTDSLSIVASLFKLELFSIELNSLFKSKLISVLFKAVFSLVKSFVTIWFFCKFFRLFFRISLFSLKFSIFSLLFLEFSKIFSLFSTFLIKSFALFESAEFKTLLSISLISSSSIIDNLYLLNAIFEKFSSSIVERLSICSLNSIRFDW